jgi:hypothetical protein
MLGSFVIKKHRELRSFCENVKAPSSELRLIFPINEKTHFMHKLQ